MPLGCVILEGGGNAELRACKAFGQWVNTIPKRSQNQSFQNTRCMLSEKLSSSFEVATHSVRG